MLTFPHPKLTPIVSTPNNTALKHLTKELYANARAIPSTRGGGGHGHLGLIMPAAEYLVVTGVAFQLPAHPSYRHTLGLHQSIPLAQMQPSVKKRSECMTPL